MLGAAQTWCNVGARARAQVGIYVGFCRCASTNLGTVPGHGQRSEQDSSGPAPALPCRRVFPRFFPCRGVFPRFFPHASLQNVNMISGEFRFSVWPTTLSLRIHWAARLILNNKRIYSRIPQPPPPPPPKKKNKNKKKDWTSWNDSLRIEDSFFKGRFRRRLMCRCRKLIFGHHARVWTCSGGRALANLNVHFNARAPSLNRALISLITKMFRLSIFYVRSRDPVRDLLISRELLIASWIVIGDTYWNRGPYAIGFLLAGGVDCSRDTTLWGEALIINGTLIGKRAINQIDVAVTL